MGAIRIPMKTKSLCSIFLALGCLLSSGCGVSRKEIAEVQTDVRHVRTRYLPNIDSRLDRHRERLDALEKKVESRNRFSESAEEAARKTDEKFSLTPSIPAWTHCLEYERKPGAEAYWLIAQSTMAYDMICTLELVGYDDGKVFWRKP